MDAVAGLLDGPRARGAFLLRSTIDPPWSLRIQDEAPLTLIAIVRGSACGRDGGEPIRLAPATSRSRAGPTPTPSPTTRPRRRRPSSTPASAAARPTAASSS